MLRQMPATHDRRGAITLPTSAAVVACALAGVLAACGDGGGPDEGYVAVERPASGGTAIAPTGEVTFVPLEERKASNSGARLVCRAGESGGTIANRARIDGCSGVGRQLSTCAREFRSYDARGCGLGRE